MNTESNKKNTLYIGGGDETMISGQELIFLSNVKSPMFLVSKMGSTPLNSKRLNFGGLQRKIYTLRIIIVRGGSISRGGWKFGENLEEIF